jgi:hypothetical protein
MRLYNNPLKIKPMVINEPELTVNLSWHQHLNLQLMKSLLYWIFPVLMFFPGYSLAQWHNEKYYQTVIATQMEGKAEVSFPDRIRVDIITKNYAIEVEFADKWYQAVGQSLYYGIKTGLLPAIVLIMKKDVDTLYLNRLRQVAALHKIKIFTIDYYSLKITEINPIYDGSN